MPWIADPAKRWCPRQLGHGREVIDRGIRQHLDRFPYAGFVEKLGPIGQEPAVVLIAVDPHVGGKRGIPGRDNRLVDQARQCLAFVGNRGDPQRRWI